MATIGDMLRSKGIKSLVILKSSAGRPTHRYEMQPQNLVKPGFSVVVNDEENPIDNVLSVTNKMFSEALDLREQRIEEARIRREDPIGADIMDQVFEMAVAEQKANLRRRLSKDLMHCLLVDEEAEASRRDAIEMDSGDPEH